MDRAIETGTRKDPSRRKGPQGSVPYRAGEPARNWHLAGSTPVGCRGFNGPVPPPLWISRLQLCLHGAAGRSIEQASGRPGSVCEAHGSSSGPMPSDLLTVDRQRSTLDR